MPQKRTSIPITYTVLCCAVLSVNSQRIKILIIIIMISRVQCSVWSMLSIESRTFYFHWSISAWFVVCIVCTAPFSIAPCLSFHSLKSHSNEVSTLDLMNYYLLISYILFCQLLCSSSIFFFFFFLMMKNKIILIFFCWKGELIKWMKDEWNNGVHIYGKQKQYVFYILHYTKKRKSTVNVSSFKCQQNLYKLCGTHVVFHGVSLALLHSIVHRTYTQIHVYDESFIM